MCGLLLSHAVFNAWQRLQASLLAGHQPIMHHLLAQAEVATRVGGMAQGPATATERPSLNVHDAMIPIPLSYSH